MEHIPVFLASDNNYAPFVAVTIASACYNTSSDLDFYIIDGGISQINQRHILALREKFPNCSIEFIHINKEELFQGFTTRFLPLDTYSRLLIPFLKPELSRAIYIDVDVVVLNDLKSLFHEDLHGNIIGAVLETCNPKDSYDQICTTLKLATPYHYFNAGVMLIDCEQWRQQDITAKLFALEKEYHDLLKADDQDLLNKYFDGHYQILDLKYNVQNKFYDAVKDYYQFSDLEISQAKQQAVVRHFCVGKPWEYTSYTSSVQNLTTLMNFNDFWFFAHMTHFYAGLQQRFLISKVDETAIILQRNLQGSNKKKIKLFNFLPLLTIKHKNDLTKFYLFGCIPLITKKN